VIRSEKTEFSPRVHAGQGQTGLAAWDACKLHFAERSVVVKQKGMFCSAIGRDGGNQIKEEVRDGH
jgi:hypothetical protein